MLSRIPRATSAVAKVRTVAASYSAAMGSRIPRPVKSAMIRRRRSRITVARPVVDTAVAPESTVVDASPVNSADIVAATEAMSIGTGTLITDKATPPVATAGGSQPPCTRPSSIPIPCQLIVGRRRPHATRSLSPAAKASVTANITERRDRVIARIASTSSSRSSSSRKTSREMPGPAEPRPRKFSEYSRPVTVKHQGTVTFRKLTEYVKVSAKVLEAESRIPSRSSGFQLRASRNGRHVTIRPCRIQFTSPREIRFRGRERHVAGLPCIANSAYSTRSLHELFYYDRVVRTYDCPYHDNEDVAVNHPHVLPRLWVTTPAEAQVNPRRPRKVRFAKGLQSWRFFERVEWKAVEQSGEYIDRKKLFSEEFRAQTVDNTLANEYPRLDNDHELQAVKTKFGVRYDRRTPDKEDPDAIWAVGKATLDKLLAEMPELDEESADNHSNFSESDFF